jgi:hypothetical protein
MWCTRLDSNKRPFASEAKHSAVSCLFLVGHGRYKPLKPEHRALIVGVFVGVMQARVRRENGQPGRGERRHF